MFRRRRQRTLVRCAYQGCLALVKPEYEYCADHSLLVPR